ncbi:uncharacterized protein [Zea mays]|uniref:uncharacterized protein isoform X5 n=1 Tax=Zea mays TaxID=4577 RepID=UPI0016532266|nr:uncharacterized protein LOC100279182 isoform X5 [Zea mays]
MGGGGGFRGSCRVGAVLLFSAWVALAALSRLLRPVPNGCVMTYMYPTYIPIAATPRNISSDRYGLFLYHEGWKQIDFAKHIRGLRGVPVLFIPGNGGSYKQVRSLAAESFRAYQNGPLEPTFYQEASSSLPGDGLNNFSIPSRYGRMLDWFAVDLEGEHSAMDGQILEEHTEYVVYAIHRILDQYKESHLERSKGGAQSSPDLPSSVILVGHSMGGFVARAAVVHPNLRKSAVETILTLSSPHQYPPIALQPSLGHFFSHVNEEWRKGYKTGVSHAISSKLSNVVVVSVSGGIHDYQIRSRLASLDGIVPSTHGFMVGSSSMKNVWLSMEHQSILWCNQLAVQVAHTLLSIIDPVDRQPFSSTQKRVFVFTKMLQSAVPQSLSSMTHVPASLSRNLPANENQDAGELHKKDSLSCPSSTEWTSDGLEKDLYIQSNSVTVLAMDGRRRWLDIKKLGSNGRGHFVFVTNLAPCSGVRIHLWPEKHHSPVQNELPASKKIVEVTSKMVQIPAGPAPKQVEPGSQTEQPPPSAFLLLSPGEMSGFRFMTISVAPRPADPHCSYEVTSRASLSDAASRFFLLYSSEILGFMVAIMFFGIMRQTSAWECDSSMPSILSAIESNLGLPKAFMFLCFMPILVFCAFFIFTAEQKPPFGTFLLVTLICYIVANGFTILLILSSKLLLYVVAILHVFTKRRWQSWGNGVQSAFLGQFLSFSSFQSVKMLRNNPNIIVAVATLPLVCLVHPAIGLGLLLLSHAFHAHSNLCSFLAASFRSITQKKDLYKSKMGDGSVLLSKSKSDGLQQLLPMDDSPTASKSFTDSQLELFDYRHGVMILHLLSTLMFVPSLVAWLQRIGMGQNFPWFIDSAICVGVILHGLFGSQPNVSCCIFFKLPGRRGREIGLSFLYLVGGYYSFVSSMALAPYRALYAMATIGYICFISRILERRNMVRGDINSRRTRKHSHRH